MRDKNEVNQLSVEELPLKEKEAREELQQLRFRGVLGYLDNPLQKRTLRRRIARILTRRAMLNKGDKA